MLSVNFSASATGLGAFKGESKSRAQAFGTPRCNSLLMGFQNMFYYGQAQARAADLSGAALIGSEKALE